jgi:purine-binding chemotaxis protein CheW
MTTTTAASRQYATFRVADLFLGIEALKVQELIRRQEMTPVPLASHAVEGLINLRGQIVIAIDTRRSLGLPPAVGEDLRVNIAVRSGDSIVSLLVDEVCDVIEIPESAYAPVPENMPFEQRQMVQCVFHTKEELLLVLDVGHVLENACS